MRHSTAHSLTVGENSRDPLGFHDPAPAYSWRLPETAKRQTAYRLEIKTASGLRDTGWIDSEQSIFVPHIGAPLPSRTRAAWRVNVRDELGRELGWSEPAHFELGLLSAADWSAKWIRPAGDAPPDREPVGHLRRVFSLPVGSAPVARARLYVTARGLFELHLNGARVGRDHFANGWTAYDQRLDSLTYDVTGQLRSGGNTLEALLGAGWFAGRLPFETRVRGPYGLHPELLLQLEITRADGSRETLVSDELWQGATDGPILASSFYDGEDYDARKTPSDWRPVVAAPDLGSAHITPKPFAPVREVATLPALAVAEPAPRRFVFDLGQNMVGWARVKIPVERDCTVTLRFAEMLKADGTLYTENYRTARSTDTYTPAATGLIECQPHFTFHGFRYVELSGLPTDARPSLAWVTGVVLHTDFATAGRFESSHAKLNQLQRNITWGWRGNALDIPTDCPQRDERAGWTGDALVFAPTALFNTASHAFWKSWLATLRDEQDADGVVPDIIPAARARWRNRSPGWMDAAVFIPWDLYVRTGDLSVLTDNYAMMENLVGWYRARSVGGLLPAIEGYGDWLQPYSQAVATPEEPLAYCRGDTPRPLLGAAFFARDTQILADSARTLGRHEDAAHYATEAATLRAAFVREYFGADGRLRNAPETQTSYALAIVFDLLPPPLAARAGEHLSRLVRAAGGHLRTGFLGTPHLAAALDRTGHADLACELLFKESYPSWFYPINQGATTMWERWNSYSHEHGFGDVKMNSFNHYAYGAIGQWMYERIAGLAPDPAQPGYKHFFVRPLFAPQLDHARAEHETPHGLAVSRWKRETGGRVALEVVVPPNSTATVEFPDARPPQTVPAGAHRVVISASE